jgi:hypothetical protein
MQKLMTQGKRPLNLHLSANLVAVVELALEDLVQQM